MKQRRWLTALLVGAFLLTGIAFGAVTTGGPEAECREVGVFDYAYKIDNWDAGNMTGDYTDPVTGVTFTIEDYKPVDTFDWSATATMDVVIVKAGTDSEVYAYVPPAYSDTGLVAPGGKEVSHVTFCWNAYAPLEVSKTADASYDLRVEWTLDKNVDVLSHTGFVGGPAGASTWEVSVTRTEYLENYVVAGEIKITNPNGISVDFSMSDVLDDGTPAVVVCPITGNNTGTVPANSFIECDYTAEPNDDVATKNVVAVTSLTDGVDGDTAEAPFTWESNLVGSSSATLTDDRFPILDNVLQTSTIVTYEEPFTCSSNVADYVADGTHTVTEINTAVLTLEEGAPLQAQASVVVICYAPLVSKTAFASYDERHDWDVSKSVDPVSQSGFAGETLSWEWVIDVTEKIENENFAISGVITVVNPSPDDPMTVAISDTLNDGTLVTLDCGGSLTVLADDSATCGYSAVPLNANATLNTAVATLNGIDFPATAPVIFTKNVVNGSATVTDAAIGLIDRAVSGGDQFKLVDANFCSFAIADYGADGSYSDSVTNRVTLTDEDGNVVTDDATTTYTCYAPLVSKTAVASYDERHIWDVSKSVDPVSQSGFAGETLSWEWVIDVTKTFENENFAISGVITVVNPSPDDPMTVAISDTLNDGTLVTLDCGGSLTVLADDSATCGYSAVPLNANATLNTAVATLNGIDFPATAPVIFTKNVVNDSATVTDDEVGLIGEVVSGDAQFEFVDTHVCSSEINDYLADGSYTELVTNNVTLRDSGGNVAFDYATTTYTCYAPLVSKDAFTLYTRTHDWSIDKSVDTGFTHNDLPMVWLYIDGEGTATWTVDVTYEGYTDSDFGVYGTITVVNPNPDADMTVTLSDSVGGIPATLDCDGSLTVAAGQTETCGYSVALDSKTDGTNTATVTFNEIDFTATAGYVFGAPTIVVDETVNVKDTSDLLGEQDFGPVTAPNNAQFTYSKTFEWEDYGADGCGDFVYDNTATIVETGDSASATLKVNVQCFVYETAYAKGVDDAVCFIPTFSQWGWTNPITPGNYEMELWAAAAQCDTGKGTLVGTVTVVYDADGYVTVTYNVGAPYMLDETHVYAGVDMYPKRGRRSTVAPGSYTNASPFDGDQVYVIAHAVVGLPDPDFGP